LSSSGPNPQESGDTVQSASAEGPSPSSEMHDRALLESVLRQTLEESRSPEEMDLPEKAALLDVAGRHRGKPLSGDPIVTELVEALLTTYFRNVSGSREFWSSISGEIAQTLFDDPVARLRLEAFWKRLCAATS